MVAFDADQHVYVANADGTGLRRLTGDKTLHRTPAWSPDGSLVVAARRDWSGVNEPDDAVVVIDVGSGTISDVIDVPRGVLLPSFAPDGETILFTRRGRYVFELWTVPVSGGEPTMLLRDAAFGAFSPDGSSIAFHRTGTAAWPDIAYRIDPSVWIANADGSGRRRLAGDTYLMVTTVDMEWTVPRWAPDGTRIAYQDSLDANPGPIIVAWVGDPGRRTQTLGVGTWPTWVDDTTLIVQDPGAPA
jgi:Tol biopolymer transport system component